MNRVSTHSDIIEQPAAVQFFGRERERELFDDLMVSANESRSGVLVIHGEAGVGKSALLEYAQGIDDRVRVLRAVGVEPETELAFAGLHQLLLPTFASIDRIPELQAEALRGALGIAPGVAENRFLVGLAVLSLLAEIATDGPTLCVLDDAHWLDRPSVDALTFAARRVDAEGIVMLFSVRESDFPTFPGADLPSHEVGGLNPQEAERLLSERFDGRLAPETRRAIIESAEGNPLALLEIPAALTPAQLSGREVLPNPMPIGRKLEEILLAAVRRLSPSAQMLMMLAAAEGSGETDIVLSAGRMLRLPASALPEAEASGMIRTEGSALVFRHPLLRSAVYQAASLSDRQAVHRAFVEVLQGEANADRHAWHRAALVLDPDDEIAEELERTAERAKRRGGHAAASKALRRAAELTFSDARRSRRLVAAAHSAWDAGLLDEALALLRAVGTETDANTIAELCLVEGEIELHRGIPIEAAKVLMAGAERIAAIDPPKALQMLFAAARSASFAGDFGTLIEVGRRASKLHIEESDPEAPFIDLFAGMVAMTEANDTSYQGPLLPALDRLAEASDPRWLTLAASAAAAIGDQARYDALRRRAEVIARRSAAVEILATVMEGSFSDMLYDRVAAASAASEEGLQLALETGLVNCACLHRAILAWVAAVRGDDERCVSLAEQATETALQHGLAPQNSIAQWAVGLLHLGLGQWESATIRLDEMIESPPGIGHPLIALRALPDLVEAAVRAGRLDVAESAATRFAEYARDGASDWDVALAARCRALIAPTSEAREELLSEALVAHSRDPRPFGRARTQLLLGEHLRRERRRREARVPLQAALVAFERLGAAPWKERARRELRATGQTVRRRDVTSSAELTLQERQITKIVADGATNKEAAAMLFLSPRTIEYHLRSVFAKLGISSRAELARVRLDEV